MLELESDVLDLFHFQPVQSFMHVCCPWVLTLPCLCGWPICLVTFQQLCVILSNASINSCYMNIWRTCKTFVSFVAVGEMQRWSSSCLGQRRGGEGGSVGRRARAAGWKQSRKWSCQASVSRDFFLFRCSVPVGQLCTGNLLLLGHITRLLQCFEVDLLLY